MGCGEGSLRETSKPARRRKAVCMLQDRLSLSERRVCEIARQHRSTQWREPKVRDDDQALRARRRKLSGLKPRWGTAAPMPMCSRIPCSA